MQPYIKYFTPADANKTLPLVRSIVRDILRDATMIKIISDNLDGEIENNNEVKILLSNIEGFTKELMEIGCYFKDWNFEVGLVDFPSIINDEEVFLCWKSDEDSINHYHSVREGFIGRKPIPEELLK
ncbi:MAG: DUF2203 family protein [Ignavibacteria bacterium]|nr:DUF2203 family protein [Ignavibacteria bacterium]